VAVISVSVAAGGLRGLPVAGPGLYASACDRGRGRSRVLASGAWRVCYEFVRPGGSPGRSQLQKIRHRRRQDACGADRAATDAARKCAWRAVLAGRWGGRVGLTLVRGATEWGVVEMKYL
jgi:hypothetical protein